MAIVARRAWLQINDGIGNVRVWTATAAPSANTPDSDYAPGASVSIEVHRTVVGAAPPPTPDALYLNIYDNGGTRVRQYVLNNNIELQTVTFHFTHDGTAGGVPAASTLEIAIHADTGGATPWSVETDGSPNNPPVGYVSGQLDRGYMRNITTAAVTTTNQTGAKPSVYALNDAINHRLTWGHRAYTARTFAVSVSGATPALSGTTPNAVGPVWDTAFAAAVTNRFPAAATSQSAVWTVPNSFVGLPLVALTTNTADSLTIDPRVSLPHRFQINESTWAGSDVASGSRHGGQLGFLAVEAFNARGERVNGLSVTDKLWDAGALVGDEAAPVKTATNTTRTIAGQGGRTGTTTGDKLPIAWENALPRGAWTAKATLNGSTVAGLEADNVRSLALTGEPDQLDAFGLAVSGVLTLK